MTGKRTFILTEAAATLPLVRRILVDVREARARLSAIRRALQSRDLSPMERRESHAEAASLRARMRQALTEASGIGVEITDGVRCEALFPFLHRWIGSDGDGKIRPAYFAFCDSQDTIREWFFAGWPERRRPPSARWWNQFRPGQRLPVPERHPQVNHAVSPADASSSPASKTALAASGSGSEGC